MPYISTSLPWSEWRKNCGAQRRGLLRSHAEGLVAGISHVRMAAEALGCPATPRYLAVTTEEQFKTLVRELRIIQIGIAVMIVILVFIAGWLQP